MAVANNGNVGEPDVMDDVRLVKTDAAVTETDVIILADCDVVVVVVVPVIDASVAGSK